MATIKNVGKTISGLTIYDVKYWVRGKQRHKRIKAENRAEVERVIALDSNDPGIGLKWSEAWELFKEFRTKAGRITRSLENTEHAVKAFIKIQGDLELGKTTPDTFKDFMIKYAGQSERSTADSANHQRKELLAVARFIQKHSGKLDTIPFENVPKLPSKVNKRSPIPTSHIGDYIAALPDYVKRPVLMVLFYGLRSSAVCNLDEKDVEGDFLHAVDKGEHKRRIPIDDTLKDIIEQALAFKRNLKRKYVNPAPLFINLHGNRWTAKILLKAAQAAWADAKLKPVKIHEIRHTLGTEAGKFFPVGIIQVLMGHKSRKSSENYFHPNEEMAVEARQKLVRFLSGLGANSGQYTLPEDAASHPATRQIMCPHCGHNFFVANE